MSFVDNCFRVSKSDMYTWALLDREGADRLERCTALVAMELTPNTPSTSPPYIKTSFSASGNLNNLEYSFFCSGKSEGEIREAGRSGLCYQKGYRHKADRNATARKRQNHDDETTYEQGQRYYNYQRAHSNNDKPRWKQAGLLQPSVKCAQRHHLYR